LNLSSAKGDETALLVRVLQSRPGLPWHLALRGLAHAVVLSLPASGEAPSADPAKLVAMEDFVLRAYSQRGARTDDLVKALMRGKRGEALVEACAPECGTLIRPMTAQEARGDVGAALAALRRCGGAAFAEEQTQGDKALSRLEAQVHVKADGQVTVFGSRGGREFSKRPEFEACATAALKLGLEDVTTCVLDVLFVLKPKSKDADDAPDESETKEGIEAKEGRERTMFVRDLLVLNGVPLLSRPWQERQAGLRQVIKEHADLKLVRGVQLPAEALDDPRRVLALLDTLLRADKDGLGDALVLKSLSSPYHAGCSSGAWLKIANFVVTGEEADRQLFASLTDEERQRMPTKDDIHFSVVSGRRASFVEGVNGILKVQKMYHAAGVQPTWYTDVETVDRYKEVISRLGGDVEKVVPAGRLIPSRNKALDDAAALKKVCVQTSDDITSFRLYNDFSKYRSLDQGNTAARTCKILQVSPVSAARYMVAVMRAQPGDVRLAGVHPTHNAGEAFNAPGISAQRFVVGDFFAAEVSPCRFDIRFTLKEDYDYTCSHLEAHGGVCRLNRMMVVAKHETNLGGACDLRDSKGEEEVKNCERLKEKWPKVFRDNPKRPGQVILQWKREADEALDEPSAKRAKK